MKSSLSVWHFQGLLIRVCFCVPAVSSGCSRQTGSEWRRPWKTVTSLLAEWDTKTLKLPSFFCHAVSSCLPLCLWTCCPFFSATLSYLHLRALSSSSSSSSSIQSSVCPLTIRLVLYSPETAADWCFAHLCGVVFSGCLHDFPLRTDLALVVMKQIDPVGAIEMTKKLFYLYLSLDISGEKRPPHALRCKHSPPTPKTQQTSSALQQWQAICMLGSGKKGYLTQLWTYAETYAHTDTAYSKRRQTHTHTEQTIHN